MSHHDAFAAGPIFAFHAIGAIELALLPSGTASTPVTSERTQQASFPWAMQQRPASVSGGATALQRSVSGTPPVPRALTNGEHCQIRKEMLIWWYDSHMVLPSYGLTVCMSLYMVLHGGDFIHSKELESMPVCACMLSVRHPAGHCMAATLTDHKGQRWVLKRMKKHIAWAELGPGLLTFSVSPTLCKLRALHWFLQGVRLHP